MRQGFFGWKTWNDRLSLLLIVGIPVMWACNRWLTLEAVIIGATISVWTLVAQYYFRQRPPDQAEKPTQNSSPGATP